MPNTELKPPAACTENPWLIKETQRKQAALVRMIGNQVCHMSRGRFVFDRERAPNRHVDPMTTDYQAHVLDEKGETVATYTIHQNYDERGRFTGFSVSVRGITPGSWVNSQTFYEPEHKPIDIVAITRGIFKTILR